ncbi:MAG: hypothetical protein K2N13_06155 [Paraprevotella sp.]|nr:hypothetical protein [Paraprevotella sp.]
MKQEIEEYKKEGFTGFVPVEQLRSSASLIPKMQGVYIVIRPSESEPVFLEKGTGGFFKSKDPNVAISELQAKYVPESAVVYIGKATTLHERIKQLLNFGAGKSVGHRGGRYLWQLADSASLLVAWKTTPMEEPREVEKKMLEDFEGRHGRLPFANLQS